MYARVGELTAFERETRARLERATLDLEQVPQEELQFKMVLNFTLLSVGLINE